MYSVRIKETLEKIVTCDAETFEEARDKIEKEYKVANIVLDADNSNVSVEFEVITNEEDAEECQFCTNYKFDSVGLTCNFGNAGPKIYFASHCGAVPKNDMFKYCPKCGKELLK